MHRGVDGLWNHLPRSQERPCKLRRVWREGMFMVFILSSPLLPSDHHSYRRDKRSELSN
jgi:hypothetical protein